MAAWADVMDVPRQNALVPGGVDISASGVVVRADRARTAALAGLGAVMLAASVFGFVVSDRLVAKIVGPLGIVAFAAVLGLSVRDVIRPPVMVELTPAGVRFRWVAVVPWDSIAGLRIFRFAAAPFSKGYRMLGLVPVDADDPAFKRGLNRASARLAGVPLSIPEQQLPLKLEELVGLMRRFRDLPLEYGPDAAAGMGRLTHARRSPHRD